MADTTEMEQNLPASQVYDDAARDPVIPPVRYEIASYGIDYDVEGIVRRLQRKEILIPPFQRAYVWSISEASRFIESLLLGLPVPGVFFAGEQKSNRLLVIDGQQRLKTLEFFFNGVFNPRQDDKTRRVFALTRVQDRFARKTYETLEERDRIALSNAVIHSTVVKQLAPSNDDTSVYHIFERLNSSSRRLVPQEMRSALFHGRFVNVLKKINELPSWRNIFGKVHARLKDQELILRFLALYYNGGSYQNPMVEFLTKFLKMHCEGTGGISLDECAEIFKTTIHQVWEALERKAFRPERTLNAAVFDSVMVGLAHRLKQGEYPPSPSAISQAYNALLSNEEYVNAVTHSTGNAGPVKLRIQKATEYFEQI